MIPPEVDDAIHEALFAATADVVSDARYAAALERILATPSGTWSALDPLCAGHPVLQARLAAVKANHGSTVQVMWTPTPATSGQDGFGWVMVVFYSPEWNGVANTALLDARAFRAQIAV